MVQDSSRLYRSAKLQLRNIPIDLCSPATRSLPLPKEILLSNPNILHFQNTKYAIIESQVGPNRESTKLRKAIKFDSTPNEREDRYIRMGTSCRPRRVQK